VKGKENSSGVAHGGLIPGQTGRLTVGLKYLSLRVLALDLMATEIGLQFMKNITIK
jgi:hypothetical protein